MPIRRQRPKRLIDDAVGETEAAQRAVELGPRVKPVLHYGGLDGGGLVDGMEGGEVGVGDAEGADRVRDVFF